MKPADIYLQNWRIRKVLPFIGPEARVLDIGSSDGRMAELLPAGAQYVGVDPGVTKTVASGRVQLYRGIFPKDMPALTGEFDAVTMLAVLEHFDAEAQKQLGPFCHARLRPGGVVLITVPQPAVDHILHVLQALRIIDGMEVDEHYGFDVAQTPGLFTGSGFDLVKHHRFQLGLNNLFVFRKKQ